MSIAQFIHRGRHMYGERTAFVYDQRTTSYGELHEQVSPGAFLYHLDHGEAGVASGRTRSAGTPCLGVEIVIRHEQGKILPRGEQVHAEVILKPGASVAEEELAAFCRDYLAGYKVPKSFCFVEAIPLTAVGKVDKVAIRKRRG